MKKDYTNSFILDSLKMPIITDIHSLSDELALSTKLLYLMSKKNVKFYNSFTIKKRDKSDRIIHSPNFALKMVQKWILNEILEKVTVSEQATAYIKGQGSCTKRNANYHRYNLYVYEIDLKNFFTAISREKVYYVFKNLGYNIVISNILANLCTYDRYLPQGGVCSPYLSNIICKKLDKRLNGLCGNRDITYTRYADDLTFSCDNKASILKIMKVIEQIVKKEGFELNSSKTRFLSPASHKSVTGITINDEKLKANKDYKHELRAKIHFMICSMDYSQLNHVKGMIAYIDSIEDGYKEKIKIYIQSFYKKDIAYIDDAVKEYNKNKIFSDLEDMKLIKYIRIIGDKQTFYEKLESIQQEHNEYLIRTGKIKLEESTLNKTNTLVKHDDKYFKKSPNW